MGGQVNEKGKRRVSERDGSTEKEKRKVTKKVEWVVEIQPPGQNTIVLLAPWEFLYYTELMYVTTLLSILQRHSALTLVMCLTGKPHLWLFISFSVTSHSISITF